METQIFDSILEEVNKQISDPQSAIAPDDYQQLVGEILTWFSCECEPLIDESKNALGHDLFADSEIGLEYQDPETDPDGLLSFPTSIGSVYICREQENRTISLNIGISRFRKQDPASVSIQLDICGGDEKELFKALFTTYRMQLQRLFRGNNIEFNTPYKSHIVGRYKGNNTSLKIDEYFSDPNADNCFSLTKNFTDGARTEEIRKTFLLLSALYHSCHGDDRAKRKNLDRFAQFSAKLQ